MFWIRCVASLRGFTVKCGVMKSNRLVVLVVLVIVVVVVVIVVLVVLIEIVVEVLVVKCGVMKSNRPFYFSCIADAAADPRSSVWLDRVSYVSVSRIL